MRESVWFGEEPLGSRERSDDGVFGVARGIELAHPNEDEEDEGRHVTLVHERWSLTQQLPLELRDLLQWSPAIHPLKGGRGVIMIHSFLFFLILFSS